MSVQSEGLKRVEREEESCETRGGWLCGKEVFLLLAFHVIPRKGNAQLKDRDQKTNLGIRRG